MVLVAHVFAVEGIGIELSGKYKLTADVRFKTVKQQTLFEQLPLIWNKDAGQGHTTRALPSGHFLFSEQHKEAIELDLLPDLSNVQDSYRKQQGAILADYDELWVDYQDIVNDSPTKVNLELIVEPKRIEGSAMEDDEDGIDYFVINTAQDIYLVELASEQIATAVWQAKDQLYLFKRTFGLQADPNWRYLQEGGHVVLQRRFEQQVSKDGALDLLLDKDTALEGVNLRLSSEDDSNIIVEWGAIPKKIEEDLHGQMRVRLFLGELLKNKFVEQEEVFLREMVVFITGKVASVINSRPLHSLHWMGYKVVEDEVTIDDIANEPIDKVIDKKLPDNIKVITVPVQLEQIGDVKDGKHRLKINLQPLNRQVGWNSRIKSAKLFLEPENKKKLLRTIARTQGNLGGVRLSQVRLVSLYKNKVPSILMQGRNKLKEWGVKVHSVSDSSELTKWPPIYSYAPILESTISSNPEGERWIDLEWQIDGWLGDNSLLHLGGISTRDDNSTKEKEFKEKILGVKATPFYMGKSLGNYFLKLNDNVYLNGDWPSKQRVDLIKFRIFLKPLTETQLFEIKKQLFEIEKQLTLKQPKPEKKILLKNVVLFQVADLQFKDLLDKHLPNQQKSILQQDLKIPVLSDDDFEFKSILNRGSNTGDFIDLKYTVPWAFPLIEPCWLEFKVLGHGKQEKQQVCLEESSGSEKILIPAWAEYIEWQVLLPNSNTDKSFNSWQGQKREFIKLSLTGNWSQSTINDQLLNSPIFTLYGEKILPSKTELNKYGGKLYFDLTNLTLDDIGTIKHIKHPWIDVNRITLERDKPFTLDEWQYINKQRSDIVEGSSIWWKLSRYIVVGLTIWWLITSGWFMKLWRGFIALFLWAWNLPVTILKHFYITVNWNKAFWWWVFVTMSLYIFGVLISETNGENYWFTFGGMAAVLAWRAFVWWLQPWFEQRWSKVADKVYGGAGTHYFSGFIVVLVGVATMLIFKLEPVAEQLAVIGYYMLVVGTILEMRALRNERSDEIGKNMIQSNHE